MLLSPEIKVGDIPGRDIVLRSEDFLLIIVAFTWFVKTAIKKELGVFRKTPLNLAIGIYVSTCVVLTLRGMLLEYVIPLKGLFYLMKYIEYFVLYFMVVNEIQNRRQAEILIIAFLLTCAITCTYANLHIGTMTRLSAPFEGGEGEPNTLGGYLVFMLAITMGIFLYSDSIKVKLYLGVLALFFILPAFLFTLSRTAYIAIVPMWLSLIILGPKKRMLTIILLLGILLGLISLPQPVQERIEYTFTGEPGVENPVVIASKELDPSTSARVRSWQYVWEKARKDPLGYGITGIGLVDGQYILVVGELGLIGLVMFLFFLWSIFKHSRQIFLKVEDGFFKGLSLGFIAAFVGLVFFNIGANGFIITRIMEPFWFMTAIVMMLPEFQAVETSEEQLKSNT